MIKRAVREFDSLSKGNKKAKRAERSVVNTTTVLEMSAKNEKRSVPCFHFYFGGMIPIAYLPLCFLLCPRSLLTARARSASFSA